MLDDVKPSPVLAEWSTSNETLTITFDHALLDGALTPASFFIRKSALEWSVDGTSSVSGGKVEIDTTMGSANLGSDVVSYTKGLLPLTGVNTEEVDSFTDFPLTTIP